MRTLRLPTLMAIGLLTIPVSACQQDMMGGMGMMAETRSNRALMQRHAQELDQMATQMQEHIAEVRNLSQEDWPSRVAEHHQRVSAMLDLIDRQMREMAWTKGMMSHTQMGQMTGMTGEAHAAMMGEMAFMRTEIEQLRRATAAQIHDRMRASLERVERMIKTMRAIAAHMRSM